MHEQIFPFLCYFGISNLPSVNFNSTSIRVDGPEVRSKRISLSDVRCMVCTVCWRITPHDVFCLGCWSSNWKVASSSVLRNWKMVISDWLWMQEPPFPAWWTFETHGKMGQMHQCAKVLCWKIMILRWNKWTVFYVLVTSHFILCLREP